MTTNGWTPIGDTGWFQASEEEAAEAAESLRVFTANEHALWAMRDALRREHPGEIVLVTHSGATVQFFPDMESLMAAVPFDDVSNGAYDLLVERPEILIV